ncbi:MAG: metallophosphoesterase family protein [Anaerolineaceae bacterium]|nr:metallophosphoesterase family protein [Anaerolineaceae bacterium]MBN2678513.1 metallophosphoesterase family protein [Anaerolineaceae bacterium]
MRFALLSDIHGNLPALEAVMEALKKDKPDDILVAGDWISGPSENEVFDILKAYIPKSVLGNSDIRLLEFIDGKSPSNWATLKQMSMLRWDVQHLAPQNLTLLRSMPEQRVIHIDGTAPIRIVHGSLDSAFETPFRTRETLYQTFDNLQENILICGHSHRPMIAAGREGKLIVNPGSVAAPLNGDTHAQYATLEWVGSKWHASLERVPYDHNILIRTFTDSGFLAECGPLAKALLETNLIGEDIAHLFFNHVNQLAKTHGIELEDYVPDDIWDEADRTFDWQAIKSKRKV